jgi:phosphoenolpyruvate carboxykinase (GTP)
MSLPLVDDWIRETANYTGAANVHICDGSESEAAWLRSLLIEAGQLIECNQETYSGCYVARPKATDVARAKQRTFMVGSPETVGPENNPMSRSEANGKVWPLFQNSMKGKTMLVVPYAIGPLGSPACEYGVQITDMPLIPLGVRVLETMGPMPLAQIRAGQPYVRGTHAVANLDPSNLYVLNLPDTDEVWSINCAMAGGNVFHPKKCHGLRLGSIHARRGGWLAEHMALFGIERYGKVYWFAAALPSACGKTTLATLLGLKTVGDDLVGIFIGHDGRMYAVTRERGFYGVAKGTNMETNPAIAKLLNRDTLFMGCAITPSGEPWWTGCGRPLPPGSIAWNGLPIEQLAPGEPASHPNARFTVDASRCETVDVAALNNPLGVPLSGIIFGGRRGNAAPLVYASNSWQHGVYMGATMMSKTTAATVGKEGVMERDPMAMHSAFGAYHPADYFGHWFGMGRRVAEPPRIFHVNWFREDVQWPGFEANKRVLEWMVDVVEGLTQLRDGILGGIPSPGAIDISGLNVTPDDMERLHHVDPRIVLEDVLSHRKYIEGLGDRRPAGLIEEQLRQEARLNAALRVPNNR